MKTDANAVRQKRHDDCLRLVGCPKCDAFRNMACGNRLNYSHLYPTGRLGTFSHRTSSKPLGTLIKVKGKMGRVGYAPIRGLHQERWSALTNLDVVTRLSEIGVEP